MKLLLIEDSARLKKMRCAARQYALGCSWDAVFGRVYEAYAGLALEAGGD